MSNRTHNRLWSFDGSQGDGRMVDNLYGLDFEIWYGPVNVEDF